MNKFYRNPRQLLEELYLAKSISSLSFNSLADQVGHRKAYLYSCVQSTYQLSHTFVLLKLAQKFSTDPHQISYFSDHANEERFHWNWGVNDLVVTSSNVDEPPPILSPKMEDFIYSIYESVCCGEVYALLGYSLALEGFPATEKECLSYAAVTQLPRSGFTSLIEHSKADIGHGADLSDFIFNNFSDEQVTLILQWSRKTFAALSQIFSLREYRNCVRT